MAKVAIIAFSLCFCLLAKDKVIFGKDDRIEVFRSKNKMYKKLAAATAGMLARKDLVEAGNSVKLKYKTLEETGVCPSERFAKQPTPMYCTGFLVAPNLLVTAGHCVVSESDCTDYVWTFGYQMKNNVKTTEVTVDNIYGCKKVIEHAWDLETGLDHAVIELDRRVKDITPLKFRKAGTAQLGDKLVIIGHPTGLPMKIAGGAWVQKLDRFHFTSNLDAYGGNSGAPVFNATSGVVEGVLARGEEDYRTSPNKCRVSIKLPDESESGEDVTYITNINELKNL